MNQSRAQTSDPEPLSRRQRVAQLCDEFDRQWRRGQRVPIEEFLQRSDEVDRQYLLRELIALDWTLRQAAGEEVDECEYRQRFPTETSAIESIIDSIGKCPTSSPLLDQTVDYRGAN